jgi:ABC-type glycerol-3-phosphate transport system substrate-binding protein
MKINPRIVIIIGIILVIFAVPLIFAGGCFKKKTTVSYKMDLEVWGVFDDSDVFSAINQEFKKRNPQIRDIRYKKISSDMTQYEKELFDAVSTGKGPDVIFFHNTWLSMHKNKLAPLPNSTQNLSTFKNNFVDAATEDFVEQTSGIISTDPTASKETTSIYAMPLFCDTLALYYNKTILNQAGIANPPRTWEEILQDTKILTKVDNFGNINQSAIALGRSNAPGGINRSSDILMLLMLQNGTKMFENRSKSATFDQVSMASNNPGLSALEFYTKFSNPNFENYTWNAKMDYSYDSFRYERTAMMINYSYMAASLKKTDPKLNFEISPVPQLDINKPVNFANYWGLAVINNKTITPAQPDQKINYTNEDRIKEAWNYIMFATMNQSANNQSNPISGTISSLGGTNPDLTFDPTLDYLTKTNKPAARRDLIEKQKTDPFLGVFANQALTAKSWPQPETTPVETIFNDMIDDVVSGKSTSQTAIKTAASRVNALIKRN